MWKAIGGHSRAAEVNRELVGLVDVVVGNEEDFQLALGLEVEGVDETLSDLDPAAYAQMLEQVATAHPTTAVATTRIKSPRSF